MRFPRVSGKGARRVGVAALLLVMASIATYGVTELRKGRAQASVPSVPARKGDFRVIIRCRGELKARRSVQVTAPKNVPELRIVWLATQGMPIKEGDPVFRFDPSAASQQLQEKEAAFKQAQAAVDQAIANSRVTAEQNKIDLAAADYLVEKAKLEASKQEIVSKLQGEESRVDLTLAESKRTVQGAMAALGSASSAAKLASLGRALDKAKADVELTRYRLQQMEVKAPSSGVFYPLANYSQGWNNAKPFQVGDQVWPGAAIAEIPDLETLEMEGKIEEIDRGRITTDQEVRVRIDSLPEATFPAVLAQLSPMTVMAWEWPPTRTFRGFAKINKPDSRLRPGMNGRMDVVIDKIPNAIIIPAKAIFARNGKPIVWLIAGGSQTAVEVEVLARNPDEVAVKGIAESAEIALFEADDKADVKGKS